MLDPNFPYTIDLEGGGDLIFHALDIFQDSPITKFDGKHLNKPSIIRNIKRKLATEGTPLLTSETLFLYHALCYYLNFHAEDEDNVDDAEKLFYSCESALSKAGAFAE